jgi:hypothetical protein
MGRGIGTLLSSGRDVAKIQKWLEWTKKSYKHERGGEWISLDSLSLPCPRISFKFLPSATKNPILSEH